MLQWTFYALVIAALLSLAGLLAEQALRKSHRPTRWVWAVVLLLTVGFSLSSFPAAVDLGRPVVKTTVAAPALMLPRPMPVRLPQLTVVPVNAAAYAHSVQTGVLLVLLWSAASGLVLLGLVASGIQVCWRRRRWPMRLVEGHCTWIAPNVGPAVVGLLRPTIVLPAWVLDLSIGEQRLILAHEAAHLRARDPLVLTLALGALVLMPWNPLLWWQLRRLRHAIEIDCDDRVLRSGHDTRCYGEALIEVGQRRSAFLGPVVAMSESNTLLEKRIEVMTQRNSKPWTVGFVVLGALALSVVAMATQVAAPDAAASPQLTLEATTLDAYVGDYEIAPNVILSITRDGSQLNAQVSGQPKLPIFAQSPTKFFYKVVEATLTFSVEAGSPATAVTLHQNGQDLLARRVDSAAAQQARQRLAERIQANQPQAGAEAMLRKTITALEAGTPNYEDMSPMLQQATRSQIPVLIPGMKDLGPVTAVEFRGVHQSGGDKYLVTHQSGKQSQWLVALGPDGRIVTLAALPVF